MWTLMLFEGISVQANVAIWKQTYAWVSSTNDLTLSTRSSPLFLQLKYNQENTNLLWYNREQTSLLDLNKLLSWGSLGYVVLLWITKIVICNILQLQLLCDLEGKQFRRQIGIAQIWARYPTKTHSIWMRRHHHHYNCASAHCSPYLRI